MRKLIEFLIRKKHWLLLILLEIIAFTVLFNDSLYHRSLGLTATNIVSGKINSVTAELRSYIGLRNKYKTLLEENARIELEYLTLRRMIEEADADTVRPRLFVADSGNIEAPIFSYITARITNASSNRVNNYFSIDKGSAHGVKPEMGVVSGTGVVGTVMRVSKNYSLVIPLINPEFKLSCKLKGSDYVGSLLWDTPGSSLAKLTDLPRHAPISQGDTVLTSGYSSIFPANLMVGTVGELPKSGQSKLELNSFSSVPIALSTDFSRLSFVYILVQKDKSELRELEESLNMPNHSAL